MQYILHMFIYIYSFRQREGDGRVSLSVTNFWRILSMHSSSHLVAIVIVIIIILIWNFHISFHLVRP